IRLSHASLTKPRAEARSGRTAADGARRPKNARQTVLEMGGNVAGLYADGLPGILRLVGAVSYAGRLSCLSRRRLLPAAVLSPARLCADERLSARHLGGPGRTADPAEPQLRPL